MIAIPAIDLIDNQIVRLYQGDYAKTTKYEKNLLEYATQIAESGLKYLHLVDLSGAKIGKLVHTDLLVELTENTSLKIDFGGGVKTTQDVGNLFKLGANQVVVGSLCAKNPSLVLKWLKQFGAERFVLALDTDGSFLKINGWQEETKITVHEVLNKFSEFEKLHILTTDIRRDGTGSGPSIELYATLIGDFPQHNWIASGGVESLNDLEKLREIKCYACVVGKALLDGKISLEELNKFNNGL